MSDELDEIIAEFITEARESLDRIDPLLVEIEIKGCDGDVLNEIFRSMHTIKGAAGFLGFQSIIDVSHRAESILKRLRDGGVTLNRRLTDVILKSVDMLRLLLHNLQVKNGKEEDIAPLLGELDSALNEGRSDDSASGDAPGTDGNGASSPISSTDNPVIPAVRQETSESGNFPANDETGMQPGEDRENGSENVPERRESVQTLRVDVVKIDKVMDLTGEVVLIRNRLLTAMNYLETKYNDDPFLDTLLENVTFLDLVTSDLQSSVMKIRMQPIKKVFNKFPRLVRDISAGLGKDVDLRISGEDTEVDKSVIEYIGDPLVHIIRNAIDHGIEPVEDRMLEGKPEKGTIRINALQKGSHIVIEVADDGKGIDADHVRRSALRKGLITEEEAGRMSDAEAIDLVFLPGFSTLDTVSELSGRGVGMDVVKTNISKLNGFIEVATEKGKGTKFIISIPLTLAIINVLMIRSGKSQYAIPLTLIEETLKVSQSDIVDVVGQKVINIRGRVMPIYELSDILLNGNGERPEQRYVAVISMGETRFCLALDELLGQEEIVIKTIQGIKADSAYVLGATITGEGKVVLILDLTAMSRDRLGLMKA